MARTRCSITHKDISLLSTLNILFSSLPLLFALRLTYAPLALKNAITRLIHAHPPPASAVSASPSHTNQPSIGNTVQAIGPTQFQHNGNTTAHADATILTQLLPSPTDASAVQSFGPTPAIPVDVNSQVPAPVPNSSSNSFHAPLDAALHPALNLDVNPTPNPAQNSYAATAPTPGPVALHPNLPFVPKPTVNSATALLSFYAPSLRIFALHAHTISALEFFRCLARHRNTLTDVLFSMSCLSLNSLAIPGPNGLREAAKLETELRERPTLQVLQRWAQLDGPPNGDSSMTQTYLAAQASRHHNNPSNNEIASDPIEPYLSTGLSLPKLVRFAAPAFCFSPGWLDRQTFAELKQVSVNWWNGGFGPYGPGRLHDVGWLGSVKYLVMRRRAMKGDVDVGPGPGVGRKGSRENGVGGGGPGSGVVGKAMRWGWVEEVESVVEALHEPTHTAQADSSCAGASGRHGSAVGAMVCHRAGWNNDLVAYLAGEMNGEMRMLSVCNYFGGRNAAASMKSRASKVRLCFLPSSSSPLHLALMNPSRKLWLIRWLNWTRRIRPTVSPPPSDTSVPYPAFRTPTGQSPVRCCRSTCRKMVRL